MFARTGVGNRRHLGCGLLGACPIAATTWADPPTLVAGLERFGGTSTVLPAPRDTWSDADINRPRSSGDQIWISAMRQTRNQENSNEFTGLRA